MRRYFSLCLLWACFMTLWGQSYGGDYDPENPANPAEPSVTMKYDFKVTAGRGGSVSYSPSSESAFVAGASIHLYASPNAGYKLVNWLQDGAVVSTSTSFTYTMPAQDVELEAVFVYDPDLPANPDAILPDCELTVEASPSRGGSVSVSTSEARPGTSVNVHASANTGYKFKGWMYGGELVATSNYYYFTMQETDMHFTALFEYDPDSPANPGNNPDGEATYVLKYMVDGTAYHTEEVAAGATLTAIVAPVKEGYIFSGWKNLPTVMPDGDLTIEGTFTPDPDYKRCRITYMLEGEVYQVDSVVVGKEIVVPEVPEKEWYTFDGWGDVPSVMPDHDLRFTGRYTLALELGDVNGDGRLSVVDLTILINEILRKENVIFIRVAADLNGDDHISVVDVTMTTNKIIAEENEEE